MKRFVKGQTLDATLAKATAGVLSKEEWVAKRDEVQERHDAQLQKERNAVLQREDREKRKRKREREKKKNALNFLSDDDNDNDTNDNDNSPTEPDTKRPKMTPSSDQPTFIGTSNKDIAKRKRAAEEAREQTKELAKGTEVKIRACSAGKQGGKTHNITATLGDTVDKVLTHVYREDKALVTAFSSHDVMLYSGNLIFPATMDMYDIVDAEDCEGAKMFDLTNNTLRVILRRAYLAKGDNKFRDFLTYSRQMQYKKIPGALLWKEVPQDS